MFINECIIAGRLIQDPSINTTNYGKEMCSLRIEISEFKYNYDKFDTPQIIRKTFNAVCYKNDLVEQARKLKKGMGVLVRGSLNYYKTDADTDDPKWVYNIAITGKTALLKGWEWDGEDLSSSRDEKKVDYTVEDKDDLPF